MCPNVQITSSIRILHKTPLSLHVHVRTMLSVFNTLFVLNFRPQHAHSFLYPSCTLMISSFATVCIRAVTSACRRTYMYLVLWEGLDHCTSMSASSRAPSANMVSLAVINITASSACTCMCAYCIIFGHIMCVWFCLWRYSIWICMYEKQKCELSWIWIYSKDRDLSPSYLFVCKISTLNNRFYRYLLISCLSQDPKTGATASKCPKHYAKYFGAGSLQILRKQTPICANSTLRHRGERNRTVVGCYQFVHDSFVAKVLHDAEQAFRLQIGEELSRVCVLFQRLKRHRQCINTACEQKSITWHLRCKFIVGDLNTLILP